MSIHKSQEASCKATAQQLLRKAKDESGVEDPKDDPALISVSVWVADSLNIASFPGSIPQLFIVPVR